MNQIQLEREEILLKEIPENSAVMKKANQIPLKLEYDRAKMRHEYTQMLNKRFNTESDDSDYEQINIE